MLKIIYLGTPQFAVPTLKALIAQPDFEVVAVVCQPDRPKGRGNKLMAPPTKQVALEHNITVLQPEKLARSPEIVEQMRSLKPDIIVMVAFGQILKKEVLELPPRGVINVHGSLLPELRGAAPINWSIINGNTITGVTTMVTEAGVDTGPMLLKAEIPITQDMTAEELGETMSHVGAELLIKTLRGLLDGTVHPVAQDDSKHTLAPILDKAMGALDLSQSAQNLHNRVRGLTPWPSTYVTHKGKKLKIIKTALPANHANFGSKPVGTLHKQDGKLYVHCHNGAEVIELVQVQPESRSAVPGLAWANGAHVEPGEKLENG